MRLHGHVHKSAGAHSGRHMTRRPRSWSCSSGELAAWVLGTESGSLGGQSMLFSAEPSLLFLFVILKTLRLGSL